MQQEVRQSLAQVAHALQLMNFSHNSVYPVINLDPGVTDMPILKPWRANPEAMTLQHHTCLPFMSRGRSPSLPGHVNDVLGVICRSNVDSIALFGSGGCQALTMQWTHHLMVRFHCRFRLKTWAQPQLAGGLPVDRCQQVACCPARQVHLAAACMMHLPAPPQLQQ